ncbi:ATP-binding protein [Tropicibacter naphthalenivorans]|uniref:histidine kinase n=1 Tax=Tropicibacter naphthalenivorans TaxID=441103 RepID=A0A0P1GC39_9RHOB|nr:ATP-binding protein [Tropicibacter naphthalenivorans]CUH78916.1 Sensory/regulatory protein RpfC [Tropicibacter naphthalenivorans]SMD10394.1 Signal transduction histidine kinase [Tropicibacter naphthalenivorans]
MWARLRENARTLRALLAVCMALFLLKTFVDIERARHDAEEEALFAVSTTAWRISEIVFDVHKLSDALLHFDHDAGDPRQVVGLSGQLDQSIRAYLQAHGPEESSLWPILVDLRDFLAQQPRLNDPGQGISLSYAQTTRAHFENVVVDLREAWQKELIDADISARIREIDGLDDGQKRREAALVFPIFCLLVYILSEVYFAGLAQRREARLRALAASANETKTRFLANVSHEIRTPLNGILGMTSELSESDLTPDQADYVRVIDESGGLLLSTINDVLDLAKVEAGELAIETRPYDLRAVVGAAADLYAARAKEKNIRLHLDIPPEMSKWLLGDGRRLRQVVHNLIANAIKFTDFGDVWVRVRPDPNGRRFTISVRDTGPGIPVSAQRLIFEPFGQLDDSAVRKHDGTGLGLTISRQLCEAMGGTLTLSSVPGEGATFTIDLPMTVTDRATRTHFRDEAEHPPDLSGRSVLVADDNAVNRLILGRFLKNTGADIHYADSGEQALDLARERTFDVILMDIQMPRLDGTTATAEIRRIEAGTPRPPSFIIAVTANAMTHQVESYLAAGVDAVLAKPVSKHKLFALLGHRALAGAA